MIHGEGGLLPMMQRGGETPSSSCRCHSNTTGRLTSLPIVSYFHFDVTRASPPHRVIAIPTRWRGMSPSCLISILTWQGGSIPSLWRCCHSNTTGRDVILPIMSHFHFDATRRGHPLLITLLPFLYDGEGCSHCVSLPF